VEGGSGQWRVDGGVRKMEVKDGMPGGRWKWTVEWKMEGRSGRWSMEGGQ
jgi:hypothetical protein